MCDAAYWQLQHFTRSKHTNATCSLPLPGGKRKLKGKRALSDRTTYSHRLYTNEHQISLQSAGAKSTYLVLLCKIRSKTSGPSLTSCTASLWASNTIFCEGDVGVRQKRSKNVSSNGLQGYGDLSESLLCCYTAHSRWDERSKPLGSGRECLKDPTWCPENYQPTTALPSFEGRCCNS